MHSMSKKKNAFGDSHNKHPQNDDKQNESSENNRNIKKIAISLSSFVVQLHKKKDFLGKLLNKGMNSKPPTQKNNFP